MGKIRLNLQMFAEEGAAEAAAAPAAEAATATAAESTAEPVTINAGDTLPNGEAATSQVAAAMNRQMQRHPELRKVYGQRPAAAAQAKAEAGRTLEQRWDELKKGEFAELYGRDIQSTIQDRFKNQADLKAQMDKMEPALKVLRDRAGVQTNDELVSKIMDDDSLYEEEANERGMTTAALKQFKAMEAELEKRKAAEQQSLQQRMVQNHLTKLTQQAEEFKKVIPGFDLMAEINRNPTFAKLTSPGVGLSVRDAYFAIHHDELAPQMMQAGAERARKQMAGTIQAQSKRPVEGAAKPSGGPSGDVGMDIRKMSRSERNRLYDYAGCRWGWRPRG